MITTREKNPSDGTKTDDGAVNRWQGNTNGRWGSHLYIQGWLRLS